MAKNYNIFTTDDVISVHKYGLQILFENWFTFKKQKKNNNNTQNQSHFN